MQDDKHRQEPAEEPYEAPTIEDLDAEDGPAVTAAGVSPPPAEA